MALRASSRSSRSSITERRSSDSRVCRMVGEASSQAVRSARDVSACHWLDSQNAIEALLPAWRTTETRAVPVALETPSLIR